MHHAERKAYEKCQTAVRAQPDMPLTQPQRQEHKKWRPPHFAWVFVLPYVEASEWQVLCEVHVFFARLQAVWPPTQKMRLVLSGRRRIPACTTEWFSPWRYVRQLRVQHGSLLYPLTNTDPQWLSNLRAFSLCEAGLEECHMTALHDLLHAMWTLDRLNLSGNDLSQVPLKAMLEAAEGSPQRHGARNLTVLNLSFCKLSERLDASFLTLLPFLHHLDISYNNLQTSDVSALFNYLGCASHLKELHLDGNEVGALESMQLLSKYLPLRCKKLVYLSINNNHIGDQGLAHLGSAISQLFCLRSLYMEDNIFSKEGILEFSDTIAAFQAVENFRIHISNRRLSVGLVLHLKHCFAAKAN